jgi:hypothetical protein
MEDFWMTPDEVAPICQACAEKMAALNVRRIRASVLFGTDSPEQVIEAARNRTAAKGDKWKKLPKGWTDESRKKMWDTLTGDRKHKVTACIKKMTGKVDDPGAFCASLADRVEGKGWRSERSASELAKAAAEFSRLSTANSLLDKLANAGDEGRKWLQWPGHYAKAIGVLADAADDLVGIMKAQGQKTGPAQAVHKQVKAMQKHMDGRLQATETPLNNPEGYDGDKPPGAYGPVMMGRGPGTWVHEDKEIERIAVSVGLAFQKLWIEAKAAKRATPGSAEFWEGVLGVAGAFNVLPGVRERALSKQVWELMEHAG